MQMAVGVWGGMGVLFLHAIISRGDVYRRRKYIWLGIVCLLLHRDPIRDPSQSLTRETNLSLPRESSLSVIA